ncbi:unnamed protein product [Effrenium voratum]|uniref:Calpain catalytic domain-containing protein n=1 Tax=Effrenium voratum TaxID=2562239 RepID=A0AA36HS01_9DINO|nr:unnamed protein product [Effrenium voratum]
MAPKKDKKKKDEPAQPELVTAYKAREPLAPTEPPDASEADAAWAEMRDKYVLPLPEWNAEAVDTAEWKPNQTENAFVSNQFSVLGLPRSFAALVAGWRRAGASALVKGDLLPEEPEPQVQPLPELKDEPAETAPDPKAKAKPKADSKAKAKAKGQPVEEVPTNPTTMQQYADCSYEGEARVVSQSEFRSRELVLDLDDAAPQLSQSIISQFAAVAEHRLLLPKGYFLWELIHPQDEEGMPLFNPHGKYIVKLFVQGKWRQVVIDDVVPVGYAMHGNNTYASLLPTSQDVNIIWPQLLAKALMQVFQDDLNIPVLPCITALTGWMPYQVPVSWNALTGMKSVRTFCSLQSNSQVDFEARQRAELMPTIPQAEAVPNPRKSIAAAAVAQQQAVPTAPVEEKNLKLGNQPQEALLEFLVCEVEEDPRQVRLKADSYVPQHGTPRKHVRDADSEDEDASADAGNNDQPARIDEEADDSDHDDLDEDDDRRSQNTHSGDAEGVEKRTDQGGSQNGEGHEAETQEEDQVTDDMPWTAPWPDQNPAPLMMKSSIQEFQSQLEGGCWVSFEDFEASASPLCSYIPPGEHVLSATLDTCWAGERAQAYLPPKTMLLRLCLVLQELDQSTSRSSRDTGDAKPKPGPPWLQTVFSYEPLRQNHRLTESPPPLTPCSCVLQAINDWRPSFHTSRQLQAPECINLTVGEGTPPSGSVFHSLLLPPGEHWYLIHDDAAEQAGSVLSVNVEGLLLNSMKSKVEFLEPAKVLAKNKLSLLSVGPIQYPVHTGYTVWAKAEIQIAEDGLHSLQLLCHVTDVTLWPFIQLSCLKVSQLELDEPEMRCANWCVSTLTKSPLLRTMSLPLKDKAVDRAGKYVLMLEANLPPEVLPKSGGEVSLQLFAPPGSGGLEVDLEGDKETEDTGMEDEAPLQLNMLTVDKVMRWNGECAENDKGLVLCERITVPPEAGDVTSALRVTVEGLPQAFLRATLVAQMPPTDEMRPQNPDGAPLEPLVPGAPINPRDYGGRRNWLSRCKKVAESCGLEIVSFSHVLLTEASTYILYVHLDEFRGPGGLDGGTWLLESFGSGSLEVGSDAMEQDLEELVRRSWADASQEPDGPPRSEKAAAARETWLAESKEPKDEAEEETEEQKMLEAVLARTREVSHPNNTISKYLDGHADTPALLIQEDPYTVAPDRPEWKPSEDTDGTLDEVGAEDTEAAVAVKALGTEGERQARDLEIELTTARWQAAKDNLEAAKERNANQIQELRQWREERSAVPAGIEAANFAPTRRELRGALHTRMEKCAILKVATLHPERTDPEPLRAALAEADEAGSKNYDADLMENAARKLRVLDASATFKESLAAAEAKIEAAAAATATAEAAEEGSDSFAQAKDAAAAAEEEAAAAASALSESLAELQASIKEAKQAKELPIPAELLNEEPMDKASALLKQREAAGEPA